MCLLNRAQIALLNVPVISVGSPQGWSPIVGRVDTGAERCRQRFSAEVILRALAFSHRLRNEEEFGDSLDDAVAYIDAVTGRTLDRDFLGQVESAEHPSASSLRRGHLRLDVAICLLERRQWQEILRQPDKLESIHVYTDGSPTLGHETQAMVFDTHFTDSTIVRTVMPLMSLAYGS